ncbi:GNAT family N-acetyltransferase [Streptomyces sp.]|uniref:GNAT family N-acetyltransferase n=1 Tax=Streptomyces sp. TaxID=1931 RepID=UPI002810D535|nr:GNAT family N-acetyltransferase [Streptomyces sp.]
MNSVEQAPTATRHPDRLRPRADDDLEACVRVLAEVHRADGYPVDWPARPGDWLAPAAALGAWVAERDGAVAGHVALAAAGAGDLAPVLWSGRSGTPAAATAVVGRLFVAPWARGGGLGALLLGRAVEEARDRGLHPVLDVVASDTAATALYERLGWCRLATVDQRWGPSREVSVHCYAAPLPTPSEPPSSGSAVRRL